MAVADRLGIGDLMRGRTKTGSGWPVPNGPARSISSIISTVAPRAVSAPSIGRPSASAVAVDRAAERFLEEGAEIAETRLLDGQAGGHARGRRP